MVYALASSYYLKRKGMYIFNDLCGLLLTFYIERFWGHDLNLQTLLDSAAECHVVLPSQIHDILLPFCDILRLQLVRGSRNKLSSVILRD